MYITTVFFFSTPDVRSNSTEDPWNELFSILEGTSVNIIIMCHTFNLSIEHRLDIVQKNEFLCCLIKAEITPTMLFQRYWVLAPTGHCCSFYSLNRSVDDRILGYFCFPSKAHISFSLDNQDYSEVFSLVEFCGSSLQRAVSKETILAGDNEHISRVRTHSHHDN